jgi:hypothetical protein
MTGTGSVHARPSQCHQPIRRARDAVPDFQPFGSLGPLRKSVFDGPEIQRMMDLEGMACGTPPILVMA